MSSNILLTYRPYNYNDSSLNDVNYFKNNNLSINFLKTNFEKNINNYDLVLIDHPGTIMNLCIGANKPIVIFINLSIWELSDETKFYLDELNAVGVVQYDINSCSKFINNLFEEEKINFWWNQRETKEKLKIFRNMFAMSSKNWKKNWNEFLNE